MCSDPELCTVVEYYVYPLAFFAFIAGVFFAVHVGRAIVDLVR